MKKPTWKQLINLTRYSRAFFRHYYAYSTAEVSKSLEIWRNVFSIEWVMNVIDNVITISLIWRVHIILTYFMAYVYCKRIHHNYKTLNQICFVVEVWFIYTYVIRKCFCRWKFIQETLVWAYGVWRSSVQSPLCLCSWKYKLLLGVSYIFMF